MDSEDMTPPCTPASPNLLARAVNLPLSPSNETFNECFDRKLFRKFNCRGPVTTRLVSAEQVKPMLLRHLADCTSTPTVPASCQLHQFEFPMALALDNINDLFCIARQQLISVEKLIGGSLADEEANDVRYSLRKLFDFLLSFFSHPEEGIKSVQLVRAVLDNVVKFLLFIGSLVDLDLGTTYKQSDCVGSSCSNIVFHLHMELHWACIETIHAVSTYFPGCTADVIHVISHQESTGSLDLFSQVVQAFLWDLLRLACRHHNSVSLVDYHKYSVFPCYCLQELWIAIIQLVELRKRKHDSPSFWTILAPLLQHVYKLDSNSTQVNRDITDSDMLSFQHSYLHCADPIGFCWWFLDNISSLYQFDEEGRYCSVKVNVPSCYSFLEMLMQTTLASTTELKLRCYLQCALNIVSVWESSPSFIVSLWDHYSKHLNDYFSASGSAVSGYTQSSETALQLLDKCHSIAFGGNQRDEQYSSYELFLRILSIYLRRSHSNVAGNEWRQIKGRIFSKFYSRKMQELNDNGLNHVTVLFVVLAHLTDLHDTAAKLSELFAMIDVTNNDYRRHHAIFRGLLSLILLCVQRQCNASFLIEHVTTLFDNLCRHFGTLTVNNEAYESMWKVILTYVDALHDIIENSRSLSLQQHRLISSGFQNLVQACKETELQRLLDILQSVFMQLRFLSKRGTGGAVQPSVKEFANSLWTNIYPFIRQHSTTISPPQQIADMAACFTLLAIDIPSSGQSEEFVSCFQYFCGHEQVNPRVTCRYMYLMLTHQAVSDKLVLSLPSYEKLVVRSWFKCCWRLNSTTIDTLSYLSHIVLGLPTLSNIMDKADVTSPVDCNLACRHFIKAIGRNFDRLPQDLKLRSDYRTQVMEYFLDVEKHIIWMLKNMKSANLVDDTYFLAGCLVKYCSQLLYVKSSPSCVLPVILDKLFSNRIMTGSDLATTLLAAIKHHLHLFIQGLSSVDYQSDPYVRRKLRDLVHHFLTKKFDEDDHLSRLSEVSSVHPIIRSMSKSLGPVVSAEASLFRHHILEIVCSSFLACQSVEHSEITKALLFLQSLILKTKCTEEKARDCRVVLFPCISLLVHVAENVSWRSIASNVISQLMDAACRSVEADNVLDNLKEQLGKVLTEFKPNYIGRALKVLELVAISCPVVIIPHIDVITQLVKNFEKQRGVGLDKQTRLSYYNLLSMLGDQGQHEKTRLITESS